MIDIGGPALLRAAAKSFASVIAVCRPSDYEPVLEQLWSGRGATTLELRRHLAAIAFARTAAYDSAIARWFQRGDDLPEIFVPSFDRELRALVRRESAPGCGLLRGARRSHASSCVRRSAPGEGALVQQSQRSLGGAPAGVRARRAGVRDREAREPVRGRVSQATIEEAYAKALAADPLSAYGGVVVLNRTVELGARRGAGGAVRRGPVRTRV